MLSQIADTIKGSESVVILPHVFADGDALGSSFALALVLTGMGKKIRVLLEEAVPVVYEFLPGIGLSEVYAGTNHGRNDLAIALDCGDTERLGKRKAVFDNAANTVNIDHHVTNTEFASINYINTAASATGEVIFTLLGYLGREPGRDVATNLYVAISTDTGGFRYSNTTPETHHIAAELLGQRIDVADISQRMFDCATYGKVKLTGAAIQSLELADNGRIALMTVTNEMIRSCGAKEEDSDGVINTARNIIGVEVAAMLRQTDNGDIKVNLRSNQYLDVSGIAYRYSGGGHKRAAGFTVTGDLEQVKNRLLSDLKEAF